MIFLLLQFNILLFITFTNSISVELPCLKNDKGQCLPNYIFTDQLDSFENREISKVYQKRPLLNKVACFTLLNNPRKEEFIPKNSENSDMKDIKNSINTVYIIEVDQEYAEIKPGRFLSEEENKNVTKNNYEFNQLRKTLDAGDENRFDVKRLKLLPEITDTKETYWNRIHIYVIAGVVDYFKEYYAEKKVLNSMNAEREYSNLWIAKRMAETLKEPFHKRYYAEQIDSSLMIAKREAANLKEKKFLLYALFVIENISKQVENHSLFIKFKKYIQELDKESGMLNDVDNEDIIKEFSNYKGAESEHWFRDIRYYDPLISESYWSYMIRCYKRNLYPLPIKMIKSYFNFDLGYDFHEFPIAYSTLLLKILFNHPANNLTIIDLEETASTKK